ncbi:MAG TPA: GlsB/YeaQ/YmgE family stress response membrane protein, partial [Candidatus Sulfomarinibacteraceae bacterium]|nr:GlsB/YeaQ/YmgE family stress response membrane protein [Candidatus Sulfomarinibacteraceae bacterium]
TAGGDRMDFIVTLIIGGIVGWLASLLMKTGGQMGIIANIVVGIVGSFLGFWLAGVLGFAATGVVARWIVAVVGAAILIGILKMLNIFK